MTGFFSSYSMDSYTLLELATRKQEAAHLAETAAERQQIQAEANTFRSLAAMRRWLSGGGTLPT